jgi:hypothetical protein
MATQLNVELAKVPGRGWHEALAARFIHIARTRITHDNLKPRLGRVDSSRQTDWSGTGDKDVNLPAHSRTSSM